LHRRTRFTLPLLSVVALGTFVAAQAPPPAARSTGIVAATAQTPTVLRAWDATVDAMRRSGDLVLRRARADTLMQGRVHERFDQYVNGVRVVGGQVTRQLAGGVTESIFGELQAVGTLPARPAVSETQARSILTGMARPDTPPNRPLELVIVRRDDGRHALAYSTHVRTAGGWMQVYLDAQNGAVIRQYNDLQTQAAIGTGRGVLGDRKKISTQPRDGRFVADDALRPPTLITYDMRGDYLRTELYTFGFYPPKTSDIAGDTDNDWTDGAVVDAHAYLGWTYDYFFKRFGRHGLDDRDAPIHAVVHPANRNEWLTVPDYVYSNYILNAFWCSGCGPDGEGVMVFGEGLPPGVPFGSQTVDYFAGALDIVAHELAHGLTDWTSNLDYFGESGALNESFSDVIGTSVEFFYQPPGSGPLHADYLCGEDIFRPGGIRSMADPGAFGDPDHYSRRYTGAEDNGGVHHNSGISNQAFYLAIEGGTNRTSGVRVTGVGAANRDQIEKVFYRAFTLMLPSNATFSTARAATLQAARDLYGAGSGAERALAEAWTAVGVN
jgi:thermolysin